LSQAKGTWHRQFTPRQWLLPQRTAYTSVSNNSHRALSSLAAANFGTRNKLQYSVAPPVVLCW